MSPQTPQGAPLPAGQTSLSVTGGAEHRVSASQTSPPLILATGRAHAPRGAEAQRGQALAQGHTAKVQVQAYVTPNPGPLTHTMLMRTRALGMPAPGPWSMDGSEKRELREPAGRHLSQTDLSQLTAPRPQGPQLLPPAAARPPDGTHLRCACQAGHRGQGPGAGARHRDPSSSGAASACAGQTASPGHPSRPPPERDSQPWRALALRTQEKRALPVCTRPGRDPGRTLAAPRTPTQVVEVILDAAPRVLLDERLHKAPGLLPVADLRGHSGVREMGRGGQSLGQAVWDRLAIPVPGGCLPSLNSEGAWYHSQTKDTPKGAL